MMKKVSEALQGVSLLLLVGALAGLVFVFAMAYPLMPTTATGWLTATGTGVFIGLWAVASAFAINWLSRQQRLVILCKAVALLLALALGAGIFWVALNTQSFVTSNFSYFGR